MEIDRKGVLTPSLQIIDNLTDQVRVIPAKDWERYQSHSEIIGSFMTHRIIETPVQRLILDVEDPDLIENAQILSLTGTGATPGYPTR